MARASDRCPICAASRSAQFRPFCSKRCADVDLGHWLGGNYAIAGASESDEEDGMPSQPAAEDGEPS